MFKIAVTVPRDGFRPGPENIFGKYHPFFSSISGCAVSDSSQCLLPDAGKESAVVIDTPPVAGTPTTSAGAKVAGLEGDAWMTPDKNSQEIETTLQTLLPPVLTGPKSVAHSGQANVSLIKGLCLSFSELASEELYAASHCCVASYSNSPSSGPFVMASPTIPESNTDTVVSAKAGVTTPSKQQVVLALGSRRCSRRQLSRHLPTVSQQMS